MLNPIFWKKVQGQKHSGRWGIVEHQIPSIKVLFKTNTKSPKHPGISLLSSESKTQLVNQRKQKVAFNPETAHSIRTQWLMAFCKKQNYTFTNLLHETTGYNVDLLGITQYVHLVPMSQAMFCCYLWLPCLQRLKQRTLQWRHNGCDGVSNYQPHHC